ncbi:MAG: hypothetical protein HGA97_06890 [Chlorobiaceae bacterium]|jgi:hypothetical protein|nr:hypothetical protein [Chlorobiaceae bacterium]
MEFYRVGELFPLEQFCTGREQHVALVTDRFFNVLLSLNHISKKEKKLFLNGRLTAYLFERKDIPFLVFDFGEGFSIDMSIDTSKFDDEFRQEWMASESNLITMFLVEASTGVLKAMRMIAVGFADEFREICSRHVGRSDIERQVRLIQTAFTTREMMVHARASTRFGA